jgi:TonB family protein
MHGWAQCDTIAKDCSSGVLELGSQAYATAHNNGTVSRIGMIDYALTPAFSDSVGAIIKRIGDEKLIPFFDKPDSIPLDITITIEQHPDSVPSHRQLFKAMLPRFDMTFKLGDYPRRAGGPKYPRIAEARGIGDTVKVSFTILADGTVAPQSVDVLKGHYRDFIRAVFDKLATTSYVPAHIGGCPVASHAVQTFIFAVP